MANKKQVEEIVTEEVVEETIEAVAEIVTEEKTLTNTVNIVQETEIKSADLIEMTTVPTPKIDFKNIDCGVMEIINH